MGIMQLEEILKDKPPTPQCLEDKAYGPCLIWTKDEGWKIIKIKYKEK